MKDKYDKLREKTQRIILKGEELLLKNFKGSCDGKKICASCLAAEARGRVDKEDFDFGFDSSEDVCMLDARDILAKKHNLQIN